MKKKVTVTGPHAIAGGMAGGMLGMTAASIACPPLAPLFIILGAIFGGAATKMGAIKDAKESPDSEAADGIANNWKNNHRYSGENGITTSFGDGRFSRNVYEYELDEDEKKPLFSDPIVPYRPKLESYRPILKPYTPPPIDIDAIMKSMEKKRKPYDYNF
jgi:hypothetical protein